MTNTKTDSRKHSAPLSVVARHPIAVLLVPATAFVWVTQMGSAARRGRPDAGEAG